jgi:hypothetical protein
MHSLAKWETIKRSIGAKAACKTSGQVPNSRFRAYSGVL